MAQKTEQISNEIIQKIQDLQSEANALIFDLGQISVRFREIENEKKRLNSIKEELETKLDNQGLQLENILGDLQKKYKNAEIDMKEGTVTYEVSE